LTAKGIPGAKSGHPGHHQALLALTEVIKAMPTVCQGQLGGFERPRSVDVVAELRRNPNGKVLKWVLREPYGTGHRRRVAGA
jgi:acyl-CoA synthetase (AMP-forming)/AMP-acid ligase II